MEGMEGRETEAVVSAVKLWSGALIRWNGDVYLARIEEFDRQCVPSRPTKILVRQAQQGRAWFRKNMKWKHWDELNTPIEELPTSSAVALVMG